MLMRVVLVFWSSEDFLPRTVAVPNWCKHRIGIRSSGKVENTMEENQVFWWLMWQVSAAGYTPRSYFTQFSEVVCHERHASHAFFG